VRIHSPGPLSRYGWNHADTPFLESGGRKPVQVQVLLARPISLCGRNWQTHYAQNVGRDHPAWAFESPQSDHTAVVEQETYQVESLERGNPHGSATLPSRTNDDGRWTMDDGR
jgi:hypothetical protein